MILVETQKNMSPRERIVFGLAMCGLAVVLGLMVWRKHESLVIVAWATGLAWCFSMLFNREEPFRRQWKGVFLPLVLVLLLAGVRTTESPATMAIVAAAALAAVGSVVLVLDRFGNWLFGTWMQLSLPFAWSVSTLLLVLAYYGVLTPIGLALRIFGRDPMQRRFDRQADSYWVERDASEDLQRYFRQF